MAPAAMGRAAGGVVSGSGRRTGVPVDIACVKAVALLVLAVQWSGHQQLSAPGHKNLPHIKRMEQQQQQGATGAADGHWSGVNPGNDFTFVITFDEPGLVTSNVTVQAHLGSCCGNSSWQ